LAYVAQKKGGYMLYTGGKTTAMSISPQYGETKFAKQSIKKYPPHFLGARRFFKQTFVKLCVVNTKQKTKLYFLTFFQQERPLKFKNIIETIDTSEKHM